MSHNIEGFLFNNIKVAERLSKFEHTNILTLNQGFIFIPLTDELHDEIGLDTNQPYEVFWKLSGKIESLIKSNCQESLIMYLETDYWGGTGDQSAAIWKDGELLMKPEKSEIGTISKGLRLMDATKKDEFDEFEAIGLNRFRSNADWIEQPTWGK